jgi:amino acid transporter
MRTPSIILAFILILSIFNCDKKNPADSNVNDISDYVKLGVLGGDVDIWLPKESGEYSSQYSNMKYNSAGELSSYDVYIVYNMSGNTYDIKVRDIFYNSKLKVSSYRVEIVANIGGKKYQGTLYYP